MTHTWQQLAYIHGLGAELPSHVFNPDKQVYHSRKPVKLVLPPKNSTLTYLNKSTPHFIHEIETIDYKVICVNVFLSKKRFNFIPIILLCARFIQISINSFICLLSLGNYPPHQILYLLHIYPRENLRNFEVPSNIFYRRMPRYPPTRHWRRPSLVQHDDAPPSQKQRASWWTFPVIKNEYSPLNLY